MYEKNRVWVKIHRRLSTCMELFYRTGNHQRYAPLITGVNAPLLHLLLIRDKQGISGSSRNMSSTSVQISSAPRRFF